MRQRYTWISLHSVLYMCLSHCASCGWCFDSSLLLHSSNYSKVLERSSICWNVSVTSFHTLLFLSFHKLHKVTASCCCWGTSRCWSRAKIRSEQGDVGSPHMLNWMPKANLLPTNNTLAALEEQVLSILVANITNSTACRTIYSNSFIGKII